MKDTGGPAFPHEMGSKEFERAGMSLRDWFAGQACCGLAQHCGMAAEDYIARESYCIADAMIAQRSNP
jgi:hypothetical protein